MYKEYTGKRLTNDKINKPNHYVLDEATNLQVKDVIKHWFDKIERECEDINTNEKCRLADALEYILRSPFKGTALDDLKKARFWLDYVINEKGRL